MCSSFSPFPRPGIGLFSLNYNPIQQCRVILGGYPNSRIPHECMPVEDMISLAEKVIAVMAMVPAIPKMVDTGVKAVKNVAQTDEAGLAVPVLVTLAVPGAAPVAILYYTNKLSKDAKNHEYKLQQETVIQASRRLSHIEFLKYLEAGNCGYIQNPETYQRYWEEVILHHPMAEFSHGGQFKKCLENAALL